MFCFKTKQTINPFQLMDLNMNSTHNSKKKKKERKNNRKERKTWPCPELCNWSFLCRQIASRRMTFTSQVYFIPGKWTFEKLPIEMRLRQESPYIFFQRKMILVRLISCNFYTYINFITLLIIYHKVKFRAWPRFPFFSVIFSFFFFLFWIMSWIHI